MPKIGATRTLNREKNARRREAKRRGIYRQGRKLRQAFKGAFGHAPNDVYNHCASGTILGGVR